MAWAAACPERVLLFRAPLGKSLKNALCSRFVVLTLIKTPLLLRDLIQAVFIFRGTQSELRNVCQLAVCVIQCFYSRSVLERALGFFVYEDNQENPVLFALLW